MRRVGHHLTRRQGLSGTALGELYRRRWRVEGSFRGLKTMLGLDVLRTQPLRLIEREILLHALAYDVGRALMLGAACVHSTHLLRGHPHHLAPMTPILASGSRRFSRES